MEGACPFWLLGAMQTAIDAAARAHNVEVWKEFPGGLAEEVIKGLAENSDTWGYSARALG